MAKKKVVKKKIEKEIKKENAKTETLSNIELLQIDLHNEKVISAEFRFRLIKIESEKRLLEASQRLESERMKNKKFNDELRKKFNIKSDKWSYDHLTGEIIRDE